MKGWFRNLYYNRFQKLLASLNADLEGGKDLCLFLLSDSRSGLLLCLELPFLVSLQMTLQMAHFMFTSKSE